MKIETTVWFDKQVKLLAKKYKSMLIDYSNMLESLEENPTQGIPLGRNAFKIDWAITSKGRGKRGGAQVITYVRVNQNTIYLVDMYDKSELKNLREEDWNAFIEEINTDLLILPSIFICSSQNIKNFFQINHESES